MSQSASWAMGGCISVSGTPESFAERQSSEQQEQLREPTEGDSKSSCDKQSSVQRSELQSSDSAHDGEALSSVQRRELRAAESAAELQSSDSAP